MTVDDAAGLGRDDLMRILWAERVLARRYFFPGCHRMEPYRSSQSGAGARLPATEYLASRVLCLPTGTTIGRGDIVTICQIIRFAVTHWRAVGERLRNRTTEARR